MNTIIYFNNCNINNPIDKIIFNKFYPEILFENYNPSDIESNENFKKNIIELNEIIQNNSSCISFFSKITDYPFSEDDLLKLFDAEYVIFLKSKFFKKKVLLELFDKYKVIYLNYAHKEKINHTLKMINFFVKNAHLTDKKKFLTETTIQHINQIYFSNNEIEPNILYKKISFSNQDIFMPFNTYAIKKIEYKLRTFCQIAEKLGAKKIIIKYNSYNLSENKLSIDANVLSSTAKIETKIIHNNELEQMIDMIFEYPDNLSNITLNKFDIINLIINESEFFMQSDEFNADIDLKFLLDARCINLIQKYNTNIIINCMNQIEESIMLTVHNYGVSASYNNKTTNNVQINIDIQFLNIYANPSCIDGSNLYMEKEGFSHLVGIINEQNRLLKLESCGDLYYELELKKNSYIKINNYIRSYFDYLTKQKTNIKNIITVSSSIKNINNITSSNYSEENVDLIEAYYYIIDLNYNEREIIELFYDYFDNNLNYYNFKLFIGILSKGYTKKIDKLTFIAHQYHLIQKHKLNITNCIKHYINQTLNKIKIFFSQKNIINSRKLNSIREPIEYKSESINNELRKLRHQ